MSSVQLNVKLQLQAAQIMRLHEENQWLREKLTTTTAELLLLRNAMEARANAEAELERSEDQPDYSPAPAPGLADLGDEDGDDDGGPRPPCVGSLSPQCDEE